MLIAVVQLNANTVSANMTSQLNLHEYFRNELHQDENGHVKFYYVESTWTEFRFIWNFKSRDKSEFCPMQKRSSNVIHQISS